MKVSVRKITEKDLEQVIIECVEITPEIRDIRSYALAKGAGLSGTSSSGHLERLSLEEIFYFEAVDEKVFAYTEKDCYLVKGRLYELEKAYTPYHFARCSKSVVLNLMRLGSISPALNGRFFAHMRNGERLIISRQYAPTLKEIISGEQHDEHEKENY
jgi:DNA-binding LytR/AlgR family response regulator